MDEKEVKKENCKSSCGEEAEFVVWQGGVIVLPDMKCVVEPKESGDNECGGSDVKLTSVVSMVLAVFVAVWLVYPSFVNVEKKEK